MKIKEYTLDEKLVMEIGKFAILWNLFEKIHCSYNCTPEKIKDACKYLRIDKEKQAKLAEVLNTYRKWFEQFFGDFIENGLYSNKKKATQEEKDAIEAFLKQEGEDLNYGCLLCVYRIRNNMMHGLKDVKSLNKQFDIFQTANDILENI